MYMYKGVIREKWIWCGLAIAIILAMIGMAMMPIVVGDIVGGLYIAGVVNNQGATAAALVAGGWSAIGSGIWALYGDQVVLLGLTGAALGGAILIGAGVGLL